MENDTTKSRRQKALSTLHFMWGIERDRASAAGSPTFEVKKGDADKSISHIAFYAFEGDWEKFQGWLENPNSEFGSVLPIDYLDLGDDSLIVKSALMKIWLKHQGLSVEIPRPEIGYKVVLVGGFSRTVPSSWKEGDPIS